MRPELRQPDEPALRADGLDELVALITRVLLQATGKDVREAWRLALGGELDHVRTRLRSDMAQIAYYSQARHLRHDLPPEAGEARVVQLGVARAGVVLRVVAAGKNNVSNAILAVMGRGRVRELHDADAEIAEEAQEVIAVLDAGGVLPAEDDAGDALLLRGADILHGVGLHDEVRVLIEPLLPLRGYSPISTDAGAWALNDHTCTMLNIESRKFCPRELALLSRKPCIGTHLPQPADVQSIEVDAVLVDVERLRFSNGSHSRE